MEKIKSMSASSLYSKIRRAVLFVVVALIFSINNSCGNSHSYPRELVVADSLCDNNPDSALTLIRKIKTDQLSDNESWYLRLLKIKQKVKGNENFTDDKEAKVLVDHFEKDGDKNLLPQALYCAGCIYISLNDTPQAIGYFQRVLNIYVDDKHNIYADDKHNRLKAQCYYQLGYLYSMQGLDKTAIPWQKKALEIHTNTGEIERCIYDCENIAWSYQVIGKSDSTEIFLQKAWHLAMKLKNERIISEIASQFASMYNERGNLDKAKTYINIALANPQKQSVSPIYSLAMDIYSKLGDTKHTEAFCDSVMKYGNVYGKKFAYQWQTRNALHKNGTLLASPCFEKYIQCTDSIEKINPVGASANANALYNYSLIENSNTALKIENNTQRTFIVKAIFVSIILFLMVVILTIVLLRHKKTLEERLELNKKSLKEAKMLEERANQNKESHLLDKKMATTAIYKDIIKILNSNSKNMVPDWQLLSETVYGIYPVFSSSLCKFKKMSEIELHVCLLLKIGISAKDIAKLVCRSEDSVYSICRRLYKKNFSDEPTAKKWKDLINSL